MGEKNNKKRKGLPFKIIERIVKGKYKHKKIIGIENIIEGEPSIIVGNHAQLSGPLTAQVKFPYKKKIWCIGKMLHLKEVPPYAFQDFWGYKPKWTHWFYKILAYIISPLCVYIFRSADTIGVYKDARGISTFKNSIQSLKNGEHLIIFPECHEKFNEIVNEFQDRFVDLARLYFKDTGKEISFVPMYNAPKINTLVYGEPIKFNANEPIEEQRKTVVEYLKKEITKMAKELPVHTVVPYANVKKKNYPKSK